MPIVAHATGTLTTTINTEHTLSDISVAGTFTLHVDLVNMAAGDYLEIRAYQIVLTGGSRRVAYFAQYTHAQPSDNMIAISVPISNELSDAGALRFTIVQKAGTSRAFPWKVLRYF